MNLAIMQPYIFPYIGYFQLINCVDRFIIYDDVNFITRGYIHRNSILIDSSPHRFTIPVKEKSQNRLINEHFYSHDETWKSKFLKKIHNNYNNAPHYDKTIDLIKKSIEYEDRNVSKFNFNAIKLICQYLGITTEFYFSSEKYHNSNLYAEDRILDICKRENAKSYINPAGGIALYKAENFKRSNIDLKFINTSELFYNQNGTYFVPHLSIIDTMMFCSVDDIKDMLKLYKLS